MKDEVTLINEVMQKIPNKYMAVIVAAKRAKELNQGVKPLIKTDVAKPTTLALNEIAAGTIEPGLDSVDKEMLLIDSDSDEIMTSPELIIDEIEEEINEVEEDEELIDEEIKDEDLDEDEDDNEDIDIDESDDDMVFDEYDDEDDDDYDDEDDM